MRRSTRCRSFASQRRRRSRRPSARAPTPPPPLVVGAALDDPAQAPLAQKLGLRVVRMGVTWPAGATAPDPGLVTALQRIPGSLGVVVELTASPLPVDDAGRAALAQYAASLAQQVPQLRDLLLAPAPTGPTAAA